MESSDLQTNNLQSSQTLRQLTLILGGARSGKSRYAEKLAAMHNTDVLYIATAEAWDEEMAVRIANHQADRPAVWQTLEAPKGVGAAVRAFTGESVRGESVQGKSALGSTSCPAVVLLDCLTMLASNVLLSLPEDATQAQVDSALHAEIEDLLAVYATTEAHWIIVSNEVGLGIVPAYPLGRLYRDALGKANQHIAQVAHNVLFMVAGLPMVVKGETGNE